MGDVTVELLSAFGSYCGSGLQGSALFGDDAGHHLIHPAGRHVVSRHIESGETHFLVGAPNVEALTACCMSHDRGYLAVCELVASSQHDQVSIYDCVGSTPKFKKRLEPNAGHLTAAAFSPENPARFLAFISGRVEVVIVEWQTDRLIGRVLVGGQIDKICFAPHDSNQISVSGPNTLKLPRLRDGKGREGVKSLPSFSGLDESSVTIADHAWIEPGDGTLIACTREPDGKVYILSSQEMKVIGDPIETPFQDVPGVSGGIPFSVRCFSHGFILGGSDGLVGVWERVDSGPSHPGQKQATSKEFRHVRTVRVRPSECASPVTSLDMPATEESLIMGFANNDIGYIPVASLYISRPGDVDCAVFSGGFHNGPVTGLDMASQRPLIVSACQKDSSLRIWNYASRQCDLRMEFSSDPPIGVAMHPFGYFIAVSFSDKLRIYQVLASELKLHREFAIPRIKILRFSNAGHLLVAAQGKSVHIFTVRSFSKVVTSGDKLKGHTLPIKAMCFEAEDNYLYTCGEDGLVCEWDTSTWKTARQHSTKNHQYCVASASMPSANHSHAGDLLCCAVEGAHFYLQCHKAGDEMQVVKTELPMRLKALCHVNGGPDLQNTSAMFAGTAAGALSIFQNPAEDPENFKDLGLHVGACTSVCVSTDGRTLVTAGADGVIFVLGVAGLITGEEDRGEADGRVAEAEVVLINRNEIQQQQDEFQLLQQQNAMLKGRLEEERSKLEAECESRVQEARQRDQAEIQELLRRCDSLKEATEKKEQESTRVRTQMEDTHAEAAKQLEHLYERKLEFEAERLVDLKAEQVKLEGVIKDIRKQTDLQLEEERNSAQQELERQLAEKELEIQKHKDLLAFSHHHMDRLLKEMGRCHDQEVAEMKVKAYEELEERKRVEMKLRREQETLWMGLTDMQEKRDEVEKEQHEAEMQIAELKARSEVLSVTEKSLLTEKQEREKTLEDKNCKIEAYQAKVKDLKKFRHMLNRDLKEVTESLQPKDHMIKQLQQHLHEFEMEFERQLKEQRGKEDQISQKVQQITCLAVESQKLKKVIAERNRTIGKYTNDLHHLVTSPDLERKDWPAEIRRIYHVHVCKQNAREDRLPIEEIQRSMRQMEGKVTTLTVKGAQMEATCKKDIQRKAQENATLVHELNQLRVQNKSLQTKVKTLELKLQGLDQGSTDGRHAIENEPRPSSAPAPPPPATKVGVPKVPSGGALPGPRQRAQSPFEGGSFTAPPAAKVQQKGMLGRSLRARSETKVPIEERKRLETLKLTADVNSQHLQVQKRENAMLRKQISEMLKEEGRSDSPVRYTGTRSSSTGRISPQSQDSIIMATSVDDARSDR